MGLKDIKLKIKSVGRTRKVTKAMEAVSAVKMRKSQVRALSGRPYAAAALSILERLSPSLKTVSHPLTESRPLSRAALIVVTSDKGLCGVLNTAVLKEASHITRLLGLEKSDIDVYAFGRKASEFFENRGYPVKESHQNVSDDVEIEQFFSLSQTLVSAFSKKEYDQVHLVYTKFTSTFEQKAVSYQILPLSVEVFHNIVENIALTKAPAEEPAAFYTVETEREAILEVLIPRMVSAMVYHALLESKASEHSARMVAMKNASDKSRDLSKSLTRTFNKARQAVITREVSEIVGGIEAMAAR